jgi:plastocyanin
MTVTLRLSSLALLAAVAACGGSTPPPPVATGGGKTVDTATAGTITGRVVFEGAPPAAQPIKMGSDASCTQGGTAPVDETVVVAGDGGLKNVFVHIKQGVDAAYSFAIPTEPVVLDQKGCVYVPRVIGVRAGQPVKILNSDSTMHNVHSLPVTNQELNQSTPVRGFSVTQTFTAPEVPVRFMCNVHNWMAAWVGVVAHPYFAVTDASGAFSIQGVPPGTYTVEAWHEKFGTKSSTITIGEKQNGSLSFSFAATSTQ